jgi:hypothetical protein
LHIALAFTFWLVASLFVGGKEKLRYFKMSNTLAEK